ncbi:GNAT family N-acetyltransferase [Halomonas sp. EGI 63088]|uniref:tRNA(Met) cytidine acetyltransferase TmcA n=1 Tax=Halomonas flagellata TaxID=2920385 RepID=A0ABS9RVI5_9GAMM|nr:GNAT family N-acetyltransferase [Halomonas flagellata]MCH4563857.1 GNAT family N-acetyltransferase [Halomonas flagellata]
MHDECQTAAIEVLIGHARTLAGRHWRGLVWLTGEPEECRSRALALWRAGDWGSPLWVVPRPPGGVEARHWLAPAKARTRLGGELGLLVIDTVSDDAGFDPEAFGALSGTLRAGSLLVLMTPPDWGARPDADYARLAEHPHRAEELTAHYLQRLARQLCLAPGVVHWPAAGEPQLPPLPASMAASLPPEDPDCLTRDQAEAVARLIRLRRRRPLVLTADRGRGKSAALGIACARLLVAGEPRILVTAPRPSAVAALFERLEALCPGGSRQGHAFVLGSGRVAFLPPDELSALTRRGEAGGPGQWLLVDEAAAIPATLLGEWLEAFPRIAFATTVHGYEGSGRGFALRFRQRLERRTPEWHDYHLNAPIRWAAGDPLEALVTRLLLLDAEPGDTREAPVTMRRVRRAELADDERRLGELFGLLVQAHYRTTPSDLRRLLDGPGVAITTLEAGASPQAVLVTTDEGGFDVELAERVARGERRPRGHLMAQSLAAHAGCRDALSGRLRRVLRIAVHPGQRRRGLGRRLLEAERQRARRGSIDLLGASFGAEPGLIAFWQALGFRAVRLGLTRETATGEHALMVVAPVSARGEGLAVELETRFHRQLPGLLAFELAGLEPEVAAALLAEGDGPMPAPGDLRDIDDVAFGHREPALARPALQALARRALATGLSRDAPDLCLLVAWAFQGHGTERLAARLGVSGQRAVTTRLRLAVAALRERIA